MTAEEKGADRARALALRYLEQMKESGETEVYVDPEIAEGILGARRPPASRESQSRREDEHSAPRGGPERSASRTRMPSGHAARAAAKAPARPGSAGSVAEKAATMPEVVTVELAIGCGPRTGDMFSERSGLEECSSLADVEKIALACTRCELAAGRTNVVFGVGNPSATLMFVGEAPGRDEDAQGIPFVGRAGQLLNKILEAAGIERDDVYIGNIIKCRPPNNRTPLTSEIDACMPYLAKQMSCIRPRIICTLGLPATQTLLGLRGSMASLRGKIYRAGEIAVVPTYHPAAALRDPRYKRPIWEDFLIVRREYDDAGGRA